MKKLTTNDFIKRSKNIHGDKYDYSLVDYKSANEKVKIICKIHGEFEQLARHHMDGSDCRLCVSNNIKYTNDEFINKSNEKHNYKYDYILVNYINSETKVKIIC